jgi:demethylmenaquinone methyltransferase/2-methoxy-6-polyprenyl-1,4-benzoquinol methylase
MTYPLKDYYSRIYRRYDLINSLFTLGMDQRWRRYLATLCLMQKPHTVLDLCCGTGDIAIMLGSHGKDLNITGYDFNERMLEMARKKSGKRLCSNIVFQQGDALHLPFADETFDAVTIGFGFRNLTYDHPEGDRHIAEIYRVLKPNGVFYILESGIPEKKWIRFFYRKYLTWILIPMGSLISGDRDAYRYLAKSAAEFYSFDQLLELLKEKGFSIQQRKRFFMGAANLIVAGKKANP